jgi:hypothetical protein
MTPGDAPRAPRDPRQEAQPPQAGGGEASRRPGQDEGSQMDDFEVIRERQEVMAALAALTDQYRRLNAEMNSRETLRWMIAP